MTRKEKDQIIAGLVEELNAYKHFYLADTADLNAEATSLLRRTCFEKEVKMIVVKNTLLSKALEKVGFEGYEEFSPVLKTPTSILFTDEASIPAKLIKKFRKTYPKPLLKAAYVEESVYIGENNLDALVAIKSKEELIGDLVALLQSPAKTVLSQLQSGKTILAGVVKTLSEK